jgi:putative transport protein
MVDWFPSNLRSYPEIAIFLSLALGYYFGSFTYKGLGLGAVTATLIAAVIIGQLGITISPPLKATVFLMFLFSVGYGVGPQFVQRHCHGWRATSAVCRVVCVVCLAPPFLAAKVARFDVGSAVGLYPDHKRFSASILATESINRLGLPPDEKALDVGPRSHRRQPIFT